MQFGFTLRADRADRIPNSPSPLRLRGPQGTFVAALLIGGLTPLPLHAVDGCQVLLCLSSADWQEIPMCVPPVREVLRDLRRGRPLPTCNTGDDGTQAANEPADPPRFCPPQYTQAIEGVNSTAYQCQYDAAVSVHVRGALWTRVWWNWRGETVTEYSPAARQELAVDGNRFDADLAAWQASRPQLESPAADRP